MSKLRLLLLLLSTPLFAQYTNVSGVVKDPSGIPYSGCTIEAVFVNQSSLAQLSLISGSTFQTDYPGIKCDAVGNIPSFRLPDNNQISPTPSQWKFNVCDQTGKICFNVQLTITGASQNISTALQNAAPLLTQAPTNTVIPTQGTATASNNFNSGLLEFLGSCWNGSSAVVSNFSWQDVLGAGTNPTEALTLTHSGCSGVASVLIPFLTNIKNLDTIRFADGFTGSDCVAKINSADSDLGSSSGEIWVTQNCGLTWTSALSLSANHIIRLFPGTYVDSSTITLNGNASGIVCMSPEALGTGTVGNNVSCVIQEANGSNLAFLVTATGSGNFLYDLQLDGNRINNPTEGVGLFVNKSGRFDLKSSVQNFMGPNVYVLSTLSGKESCCGKINHSSLVGSANDGLLLVNTSDWFIGGTEVENNGIGGFNVSSATVNTSGSTVTWVSGSKWTTDSSVVGTKLHINGTTTIYTILTNPSTTTLTVSPSPGSLSGVTLNWGSGIELSNSPTLRTANCDVGGNTIGLISYGTTTGIGNGGNILTGCQYGNNVSEDIILIEFDTVGGGATGANTVISNTYNGSSKSPDAVYPEVHIIDGGNNAVVGNTFLSAGSPNRSTYGIVIEETSLGRAGALNAVTGNTYGTLFSAGQVNDTTANGDNGNWVRNQFRHRGGGGSAQTFDLFDATSAASNPHKFFRVNNGILNIVNSAFGAVIWQLTDTGQEVPALDIAFPEISLPASGANTEVCYGDSTAHVLKCSYNAGTFFQQAQVITATSAGFATATTAGTCVQNTTAVSGATTAMSVSVSPVSTPGVGAVWSGFVSSAGVVTIDECAVAASAGGTISFNIRVTP